MKNWTNLNKPPVIIALFQIKYNSSSIDLDEFLRFDELLRQNFPKRKNNINVGIDLGSSTFTLGVKQVTATSDAKIGGYVYLSNDGKERIEFLKDTVSYIDERPYSGWENFKESILKNLHIISEVLNGLDVLRISIRFINRFTFDNFDNPQDYFKTLISSSSDNLLPYPLRQYSFRLIMDIPNSNIHCVVNQSVDNVRSDNFVYMFDIDVLDKQLFHFNIETISNNIEILRDIKNEIFFSNVTSKTLDLCN